MSFLVNAEWRGKRETAPGQSSTASTKSSTKGSSSRTKLRESIWLGTARAPRRVGVALRAGACTASLLLFWILPVAIIEANVSSAVGGLAGCTVLTVVQSAERLAVLSRTELACIVYCTNSPKEQLPAVKRSARYHDGIRLLWRDTMMVSS